VNIAVKLVAATLWTVASLGRLQSFAACRASQFHTEYKYKNNHQPRSDEEYEAIEPQRLWEVKISRRKAQRHEGNEKVEPDAFATAIAQSNRLKLFQKRRARSRPIGRVQWWGRAGIQRDRDSESFDPYHQALLYRGLELKKDFQPELLSSGQTTRCS